MRPAALSSSTPSSPCFPADAPRLLIPRAGSIRRQLGSGGCRSAQGRAQGDLVHHGVADGRVGARGFFFDISAHADGERRGPVPIRRYLRTCLAQTFPMRPSDSISPSAFAVGMPRKEVKNRPALWPSRRSTRAPSRWSTRRSGRTP